MRLVSLCPSLTELVFALGRGDWLVGRTKFCVQPHDLVEAVEKVGGTKNPKIARIVELNPDLVLMNEEENRREDADALRAAGLRCHTSMPRNTQESMATVRSVGAALGEAARADAIAHDIQSRRDRVMTETAGTPHISFAYLIWRAPYMTVSGDTYISALLADVGGTNAFASRGDRYAVVTPDELRDAAPDVVLLPSEPFPFAARHLEELVEHTGLPRERFLLVDGELLSWHGPRTGVGLEYARSVLVGEEA